LRGRFLAHVAELEFMGRLIVAGYLSRSEEDDPRFRILHDELLRRANFNTLASLVKRIVGDQEEAVCDAWAWLPRDLRLLADRRNNVAHIPAPWLSSEDPLEDPEAAVALLLKVDAGLANFGTMLTVMALNHEPGTVTAEAHYSEWGRAQAAEILRGRSPNGA
jgi:hypothetical protein